MFTSGGGVPDILGQGDAGGLEQRADGALGRCAQGDFLAVTLDGDLLQAVEVAQDIRPFGGDPGFVAACLQLLPEDEGKE